MNKHHKEDEHQHKLARPRVSPVFDRDEDVLDYVRSIETEQFDAYDAYDVDINGHLANAHNAPLNPVAEAFNGLNRL